METKIEISVEAICTYLCIPLEQIFALKAPTTDEDEYLLKISS